MKRGSIGAAGVAPMYCALLDEAMTAKKFSVKCSITTNTARALCEHLHYEGEAYIADWELVPNSRMRYVPVYRAGQGADIPCPYKDRPAVTNNRKRTQSVDRLVKVLRLLRGDCITMAEIVLMTGIRHESLAPIRDLLSERGLIFVKRWEKRQGAPAPRWSWGPDKTDAPYPRRKSKREVNRAWREKKKEIRAGLSEQVELLHRMAGRQPPNAKSFQQRA